MEKVLKLFPHRLRLDKGEEIDMEFSDTAKERLKLLKFFVVGKVLTRKKLQLSIVMMVIKELWKPKAMVEAMAIGEDRMLFSFNTKADMLTVLCGRP